MKFPRSASVVAALATYAVAQGVTHKQNLSAGSLLGAYGPLSTNVVLDGRPTVSGDGRWIAFHTHAFLDLADTNDKPDVYVKDALTGAVVRVSVDSNGAQGNDALGASFVATTNSSSQTLSPFISQNGRFVVFASTFDNLAPGDTNGRTDVYLHDRDFDGNGIFDETAPGSRKTVRCSVKSDGSEAGVGSAATASAAIASCSNDGRHVVFASNFADLVAGDTNGFTDVFVRDRDADNDGIFDETGPGETSTVRASVDNAFVQGTNASSSATNPSISGNGRYVMFQSSYTNLVLPDANSNTNDVYVRDRDADNDGIFDELGPGEQNIVRVNLKSDGAQATGTGSSCQTPGQNSISADGRFALFCTTFAMDPSDTESPLQSDVWVRDRDADVDGVYDETGPGESLTRRVQYGNAVGGLSALTLNAAISPNGRFVVFRSTATNLAAGDANAAADAFVRDLQDPVGPLVRVSVNSGGVEGEGVTNLGVGTGVYSNNVDVSDQGVAAYLSSSANLDSRDGGHPQFAPPNNNLPDVFTTSLFPRTTLSSATPSIGTTVALTFKAPQSAGKAYLAGCSLDFFPGTLFASQRLLPMNVDDLLIFSVTTPEPLFQNFSGTLDGAGVATNAAIDILNDPLLVGVVFYAGFVVLDGAAPDGIAEFSNAAKITIAP